MNKAIAKKKKRGLVPSGEPNIPNRASEESNRLTCVYEYQS